MQFVFTDIEGSSRLWLVSGDAMQEMLSRHDELVRACVASHGGTVVKHMGDGFFATFEGSAVRFAVDLQRRLRALPACGLGELKVKVGIASGAARRWENDYFGPPVNRASRLAEAAWGGQILSTAQALVEEVNLLSSRTKDLGTFLFGDLGEPERVFEIEDEEDPRDFPPPKGAIVHPYGVHESSLPFVGREGELRELVRLVRAPSCRLLTLVGPGGVGKTRLALQIALSVQGDFSWGACLVSLAAATVEGLPAALAEALGVPL